MILDYQPFDVEDYIDVTGKEGKVIHIDFQYTILEKNEIIILIPNFLVFPNTVSILRESK
jgi:small-conductance mechanosensitive channel